MAKKFRAIKFAGDGLYDWAVFRTADIKGLRSPISEYTNAKPIYSGCGRSEAQHFVKQLEKSNEKK